MKLVIIGCGAIVESFYIPAINNCNSISEVYLVDREKNQAKNIQSLLRTSSQIINGFNDIIKKVDGAIIATPPASHYSITKDFLNHKVAVLVEKPIVETTDEIHELIQILDKTGGKLMVNNSRRYFPANQSIKEILSNGVIGDIQQVIYYEGGEYNWPTVSGFYFNKEANSRGVMMDRGAHVIDLISWWVNDEIDLVKYEDNSLGGPESFCHAQLKTDDCAIDVKLSWLNKLSNEYKIVGTDGEISGSIYNWKSYILKNNSKTKVIKVSHKEKVFNDFGHTVFQSFINQLKGEPNSFSVSAKDVLPSIQLIEKMYNTRKCIKAPWQKRWIDYAE